MKNIHILPTEKSSRLVLETINNNLFLTTTTKFPSEIMKFQNIYITNNEEIGTDEYYFHLKNNEYYNSGKIEEVDKDMKFWRKIILTTDQDLIKDGVQTIDDEFLEWFVKNPSCEFIEVERGYLGMNGFVKSNEPISKDKLEYKIIPQEESKQETLEDSIYQAIGLAANEQGIINQALATSKVMDVLKKKQIYETKNT
jgi:hypothetical protein